MSYKIDKITDLKIIKVTVDGEISFFEKKGAYSEAINELNKNSYHRLLFDSGNGIESQNHTTGDSIDIFNDLRKRQVEKKIKLAFLTKCSSDRHKYFGILLKTITDMEGRHFISSDEAINWLCQE